MFKGFSERRKDVGLPPVIPTTHAERLVRARQQYSFNQDAKYSHGFFDRYLDLDQRAYWPDPHNAEMYSQGWEDADGEIKLFEQLDAEGDLGL